MHGNLALYYIIYGITLDELMCIIYVMVANDQMRVHMNSTRL